MPRSQQLRVQCKSDSSEVCFDFTYKFNAETVNVATGAEFQPDEAPRQSADAFDNVTGAKKVLIWPMYCGSLRQLAYCIKQQKRVLSGIVLSQISRGSSFGTCVNLCAQGVSMYITAYCVKEHVFWAAALRIVADYF